VQCKWAPRNGEVIVVRMRTCRHTPRGYVWGTYAIDEIDAIGAYCPELDRCYLLPFAEFADQAFAHLRLRAARNNQRAGVRMASDYELGAIAQLGERLGGTQEVAGSNPASSTPSSAPTRHSPESVASHEFRERFGWHMERAAAGQEIVVTRHGRPMVRLLPAGS